MTKFLSISQNTFVQVIRQPIYSVLLGAAFVTLVFSVPLTNWAMSSEYHESNQRMLEGLGLSTLLVMSLLAAAFSASSALNKEIEDRTALTVISKPVSRATFVAGKLFGVGAAVTLFFYLIGLAYLMTVRHKVMPAASDLYDWPVIVLGCSAIALAIIIAMAGDITFGWTFTSSAVYAATITMSIAMGLITFIGKGWHIVDFGQGLSGQLLIALLLTFMAVVIFVAVAIAASTRLGQVMTLMICCGVFFAGSIHPFLFGYWGEHLILSRPIGWLCPMLGYFYAIDAITMGKDIPWSFVGYAAAYCLCFSAGVFALGAGLFQRRQLEGQSTSSSMPAMVMLLAGLGRLGAIVAGLWGLELILSVLMGNAFELAILWPLLGAAFLLLMAVLLWAFWGLFARGFSWTYWVVLVVSAAALAGGAAIETGLIAWHQDPVLKIGQLIASAVAVAVMLLPATRHHFSKPVNR